MRATIDSAGRMVIPKRLRDELGLGTGEVELVVDGAGLRIEPIPGTGLEERHGRLVIPDGHPLTDDDVHELRFADQR